MPPSRSSDVRHVIVVLSVPTNSDGTPTSGLEARVNRAAALARADPSALVVVSGAAVATAFSEAEIMARMLVGRGVDPMSILIERYATTTLDNAAYSTALLQTHLPNNATAVEQLTLVSEPYHAPRSLRIFAAACALAKWTPRLRLAASERMPYPVTGSAAYPRPRPGAPPWEAALLRCLEEKRRLAAGW